MLIPDPVRRKAERGGATAWLADLPRLVEDLAAEWGFRVVRWFDSGTEAVVAEVELGGGAAAVLKVILPQAEDFAGREILALGAADGHGCVRALRSDPARGAVLLERLGPALADLGVPFWTRQEILADLAATVWRPTSADLPTGAGKARSLRDFCGRLAAEFPAACTARALAYALDCARRREAAHSPTAAVLVHGDVHEWNALQRLPPAPGPPAAEGFALVDPDGLIAEPEYDLGVILREDPGVDDPWRRARWLAARTGTDPVAVFEWGAIERVATGLLLASIGMTDIATRMLAEADTVATKI